MANAGKAVKKIIPAFYPSSGGAERGIGRTAIRLARHGCTNRPFFHIVITMKARPQQVQPIEQVGTYDPMPNANNEKLVSFNYERLQYWIGEGSAISQPVAELLGLSGFLPLHPNTLMKAWRNRRKSNETQQQEKPSES